MEIWDNANWSSENLCTSASDLFVFTHHETARSKFVLVSFRVITTTRIIYDKVSNLLLCIPKTMLLMGVQQ